ncbi:MAG TPA: EscU/YscU/HrcU family type III secretion system export apparatus switch protein [Urbifossiella sp.]|nr:EscU/YscU/HrcU family type III secretion system export apparatus switch protein [Urbifossiella sp.]
MADKPRPRRAVALKYEQGSGGAPKVVAKGKGPLADRIVALARKGNVPVREDPNLVQVLSRLKVDQEIPPELYQAVAAILAFLYKMNRPGG